MSPLYVRVYGSGNAENPRTGTDGGRRAVCGSFRPRFLPVRCANLISVCTGISEVTELGKRCDLARRSSSARNPGYRLAYGRDMTAIFILAGVVAVIIAAAVLVTVLVRPAEAVAKSFT